eukprot:IDg18055t1
MASKRDGPSGQTQGRRILRSTGEKPSTNESLTVSSEFADINRRAHEQVIQERAAETQQWVEAAGVELLPSGRQDAAEVNLIGGQPRLEEAVHSDLAPFIPRADALAETRPASSSHHVQLTPSSMLYKKTSKDDKPPERDLGGRLIPQSVRKPSVARCPTTTP